MQNPCSPRENIASKRVCADCTLTLRLLQLAHPVLDLRCGLRTWDPDAAACPSAGRFEGRFDTALEFLTLKTTWFPTLREAVIVELWPSCFSGSAGEFAGGEDSGVTSMMRENGVFGSRGESEYEIDSNREIIRRAWKL